MNTPTHVLMAEVMFGGRAVKGAAWAAAFGGSAPDLFLAALTVRRFLGSANEGLRPTQYDEPWLLLGTLSNSIPLWLTVAAIGVAFVWSQKGADGPLGGVGGWGAIAGFSGFVHVLIDFLTHSDDAHRHFWPLSAQRFHSPISYWDHDHHAVWIIPIEFLLAIGSVVLLWRRGASLPVRSLLLAAAFYTVVRTIGVLAFAP